MTRGASLKIEQLKTVFFTIFQKPHPKWDIPIGDTAVAAYLYRDGRF